MKVSVSSLVYQEGGTKRIYTLTDGCTAIEFAQIPGRARFNFFNQHGNAIYGVHTVPPSRERSINIKRNGV